MARWAILCAALLLLVSGCGETTPHSLTEKGLREVRSGKYEQAIATCNQAIEQNSQDAAAYLYRGRAYQFRNAMGDPARAIADFSEAIRLAPDSADAYYSRAIVYRDQGQGELALADEKQARTVDGHLQDIYRKLPDPPVSTSVADELAEQVPSMAPKATDEIVPESEFDQRELYEQLKEQFEPRQAADEIETPIERYNRLSRQAAQETAPEPADEPSAPPARFGVRESPRSPLAQPQPSLSEAPSAVEPRPARSPLTSPFQPRSPGGLSTDLSQPSPSQPAYRPIQSPFGQRAPAPTGFGVQPQLANPFGPQAAPRTVRPQPSPSSSRQFSNPVVRPNNPRDYIP